MNEMNAYLVEDEDGNAVVSATNFVEAVKAFIAFYKDDDPECEINIQQVVLISDIVILSDQVL